MWTDMCLSLHQFNRKKIIRATKLIKYKNQTPILTNRTRLQYKLIVISDVWFCFSFVGLFCLYKGLAVIQNSVTNCDIQLDTNLGLIYTIFIFHILVSTFMETYFYYYEAMEYSSLLLGKSISITQYEAYRFCIFLCE